MTPLIGILEGLGISETSGILTLLGYSSNKEYIPYIIEKYKNVPALSEDVEDTLAEIAFRN